MTLNNGIDELLLDASGEWRRDLYADQGGSDERGLFHWLKENGNITGYDVWDHVDGSARIRFGSCRVSIEMSPGVWEDMTDCVTVGDITIVEEPVQ